MSIWQSPFATSVSAGLLVVTIWSLTKSWRHIAGAGYRLGYAATTSCYMLATLLFLFPPLSTVSSIPTALVTAGASVQAIDTDNANLAVMHNAIRDEKIQRALNDRSRAFPDRRVAVISSLTEIESISRSHRITVNGAGLAAEDWFEASASMMLDQGASDTITGFISIRAPTVVDAGDRFRIDILVAAGNLALDTLQVQLMDPSRSVIATSALNAEGAAVVEADSLPLGEHVLDLVVFDAQSDLVVSREPVAVSVRRPLLARIVVVQSAPSFDGRYLVRWLERSGASVALRYQVSEDRYLKRFINRDATSLETLSTSLLSETDLVIADVRAVAQMSDAERDRLFDESPGHGVLLSVNDEEDIRALSLLFPGLVDRVGDNTVDYRVQRAGVSDAVVHTRADVRLDSDQIELLVAALDGAPVVVSLTERPHIALSLLSDSYHLHSSGNADRYSRFWSALVRRVARTAPVDSLLVDNDMPIAGHRLRLCTTQTTDPVLSVVESDGSGLKIATREDLLTPGLRCGWYWPRSAGWLSIEGADQALRRYVYPESARQGVRAHAARVATSHALQASVSTNAGNAAGHVVLNQPTARRRLLLIWLISALASWVLHRLGQSI